MTLGGDPLGAVSIPLNNLISFITDSNVAFGACTRPHLVIRRVRNSFRAGSNFGGCRINAEATFNAGLGEFSLGYLVVPNALFGEGIYKGYLTCLEGTPYRPKRYLETSSRVSSTLLISSLVITYYSLSVRVTFFHYYL